MNHFTPSIEPKNGRLAGRHGRDFPSIASVGASVLLVMAFVGCDERKKPPEHPAWESTTKKGASQPVARDLDQPELPPSSPALAATRISQAKKDLRSSSEAARWNAVDALVADGSEQAVEILAAHVESLPLDAERDEVVRRASTISDQRAMPAVLRFLSETRDPSVFRFVQEVFIRLADAESIQVVLDAYDGSTDGEIRARLAKTISLLSGEAVVETLRLAVLDPGVPASDGVILGSARALARCGTQPAVDTLLARLDREATDEGRSLISAQISELQNPMAETPLQSAAKGQTKFSTQPATRVAAISALLNFPSAETQELLSDLAADPDPQISVAATETLTEIRERLNNSQ